MLHIDSYAGQASAWGWRDDHWLTAPTCCWQRGRIGDVVHSLLKCSSYRHPPLPAPSAVQLASSASVIHFPPLPPAPCPPPPSPALGLFNNSCCSLSLLMCAGVPSVGQRFALSWPAGALRAGELSHEQGPSGPHLFCFNRKPAVTRLALARHKTHTHTLSHTLP